MWKEENAAKLKRTTGQTAAEDDVDANLSSVGIRPGGDFGGELDGADDFPADNLDAPDGAPPPDGAAPPAGASAWGAATPVLAGAV